MVPTEPGSALSPGLCMVLGTRDSSGLLTDRAERGAVQARIPIAHSLRSVIWRGISILLPPPSPPMIVLSVCLIGVRREIEAV